MATNRVAPPSRTPPGVPAPGNSDKPEKAASQRRPRRERTDRRREVLDGAALAFYSKGYDAASTQDIADAVGMLKGSLYYYVASKEEFLFEIISETHEGAIQAIAPAMNLKADTLDKLTAMIIRQVEYFASNQVYSTVFFREFRALSAEYRSAIDAKGDVYREIISSLLHVGRTDGTIRSDIQPRVMSIAIVEMLNSIYRWFDPEGRVGATTLAHELAMIIVVGVASAEAIESRGGLEAFREHINTVTADG
jgi:AcrR family transcriptional regulator